MKNGWKLAFLPLSLDLETKKVLKSLPSAHASLAELKGIASTIPNQHILLNTLCLQEAKDSSAVENIITSHDELFKAELQSEQAVSLPTKEVMNYAATLKHGFERYYTLLIFALYKIASKVSQKIIRLDKAHS